MYRVTVKYKWNDDSEFYYDTLEEVKVFLRVFQPDYEMVTIEKVEDIDVYELMRIE